MEKVIEGGVGESRRKFLKGLLLVLGIGTVGGIIYPFVRYLSPVVQAGAGGGVQIAKADIPVGGAAQIVYKGQPGFVIHKKEGDFVALSAVCTHLGCIAKWYPDKYQIICPCHVGVFDVDGNVVSGPPPRPLPRLPLVVEGNKVIVGTA